MPSDPRATDIGALRQLLKSTLGIQSDEAMRAYGLSMLVLKGFFGTAWLETYVMNKSAPTDFLKNDWSSEERATTHCHRVRELGEMLFHLQGVQGFDACIRQMQSGQLESTYAELEVGKMLFCSGVDFRFVVAQGKAGSDYDLEISYRDGVKVCADTKCKMEAPQIGEVSKTTVKNTLDRVRRKQLPPDEPGLILIKVPPDWVLKNDLTVHESYSYHDDVIRNFLRGTGRIVSVVLYASPVIFSVDMMAGMLVIKEFSNPTNRFYPNRNWDLFTGYDTKKWMTFYEFVRAEMP